MSKIVISFMDSKPEAKNPNNLFGILDTDTENLEWIKLEHLPNTNNFVHGMGICYNQNYFCAGIIPLRERLASNILTINLETGEKKITNLFFTKAIHGLKTLDNNRLLANSTQTDTISELIINNGNIISEDIYHHFISKEKWNEYVCNVINNCNLPLNYRGPNHVDDNHHINSIEVDHNYIYCSMFLALTTKEWGQLFKGVLFNLTKWEPILINLDQPHTVYIDTQNNICCCNSSQFTFIVKNKFEITLDGYTRGIYEDPEEKGYWIGISAYRKYDGKLSKWIEKYRGDQPLEGARIQFVNYEGEIKRTIDLKTYGREIFDLLSFKEGKWNE